ncbi:MAG TPA: hypothetical protein VF748_00130 [Candidatus Acidoferrum sp.]
MNIHRRVERRVKLRQSRVICQELGYDRIADPPAYTACPDDLRPYPKAPGRHVFAGYRERDQVSHRRNAVRSGAQDLAREETRTV